MAVVPVFWWGQFLFEREIIIANGGEKNMPSEKILEEKKQIVEEMTEKLKSKAGVFVDYKGITVVEDTEMRVKMREANVDYSVIKNRLMKFAIKNVGFEELESILVGTTSMAVSKDDPIAPARIIKEYADKLHNYFEIKAGFMDGKVLTADEVNAIARIPALPVLQAQFLGTLLAPITSLAIVLKAIAEKGGVPADVEVVLAEEAPAVAASTETPVEAPAVEETPVEAAPVVEEKSVEEPTVEEPKEEAITEAVAEDTPVEEPAAEEPKEEVKAEPAEEKPKKAPAKKTAAKKKDEETAAEEPPATE